MNLVEFTLFDKRVRCRGLGHSCVLGTLRFAFNLVWRAIFKQQKKTSLWEFVLRMSKSRKGIAATNGGFQRMHVWWKKLCRLLQIILVRNNFRQKTKSFFFFFFFFKQKRLWDLNWLYVLEQNASSEFCWRGNNIFQRVNRDFACRLWLQLERGIERRVLQTEFEQKDYMKHEIGCNLCWRITG